MLRCSIFRKCRVLVLPSSGSESLRLASEQWKSNAFRKVPQSNAAKRQATTGLLLAALKSCSSAKDLETGKKIHSDAAEAGQHSDVYIACSLVNMYAKCESMADAQLVFDGTDYRDLALWNSLLLGYAINGEDQMTLELFSQTESQGFFPDARTFLAAFMACSGIAKREEAMEINGKLVKQKSLEQGMALHSQAAKCGADRDVFVASSLVDMYARCGTLAEASRVFEKMAYHDVVTWNSLILGYAENGQGDVALSVFERMQRESSRSPNARTFTAALAACIDLAAKEGSTQDQGKAVKLRSLEKGMLVHSQAVIRGCDSEIFVASSLVDMYAKCGSMVDASRAFQRASRPNVVLWTALILGYAENGEAEVALDKFARMKSESCPPDARAFIAAMVACTNLAVLETGKRIHAEIFRQGLEMNGFVANTLVDFYGKCGTLTDAELVFLSIRRRTLVTWSALITGYSRQGDTNQVFDLFQKLQEDGFQPNRVTFLAVLTACSHAGLVDKGKHYFRAMSSKFSIEPDMEHYHCMVDMLSRANHLQEAIQMVESMPFEPDFVTWTIVLAACKKWKNVTVGKLIFESILKLKEDHSTAYLLMASIYESAGMLEEQHQTLEVMRKLESEYP